MSRPRKIIRPRKLTIMLPEDVAARLELYLANLSDGKVPQGAYQTFFVDRINEFFARLGKPSIARLESDSDMLSRLQFPDTTGQ